MTMSIHPVDVRPTPSELLEVGPRRAVIEGVAPEIDCGRFPIKRVIGDSVVVEADVFTDGHDRLSGVLRYRRVGARDWVEVPLEPLVNDRWQAEFVVAQTGRYQYTLQAWVDHFRSWREGLAKKFEARQDIAVDLLVGAELVDQAARRANDIDVRPLRLWADRLRDEALDPAARVRLALSGEVAALMQRYPDRTFATDYGKILEVVVDRERARYGSWYELFPRSTSPVPGQHGTFRDVEARLPYVAEMGFDVLYLPPIHPIGRAFRKGKNNSVVAQPGEPGSPWGIGGAEGGHTAIHPDLGTLDDFRRLVAAARDYGLEVAMDLAFQASPDHPYVAAHPEWFVRRPDGSIQYAENPPKKYQDIYPLNFESENWTGLWQELRDVVNFWIDQGVWIFRVDNPHTKAFAFWEWLIDEIKRRHSEVIFLAEAFTRPKVMYRLAKLGFSQSYTYFTWRNTKAEITEYFSDLTQSQVAEYFRPNLWPNTPDILTEYLQLGGRPAFITRLILAATLGASYGIYGPAFEHLENQPVRPGSEEYRNSEKYEIRHWDLDRPDSLRDLIARVNQIRRDNPALHDNRNLRFHPVDNDELICYSKTSENLVDGEIDVILSVVNLNPHHTQAGWLDLTLDALGLTAGQPYQVHDLLTDARYLWHGARAYVELNPQVIPAHIFRLRRRVRTERDFEYYL